MWRFPPHIPVWVGAADLSPTMIQFMHQVVVDEGLHIPAAGGSMAAGFHVGREPRGSEKELSAHRATQNKHMQQIPH